MIRLEDITKVFEFKLPRRSMSDFFHPRRERIVAVDSVSLDIKTGEIFGLLGPNGAGKTTIIQMLAGLLKPTSGQILIDGEKMVISHRGIGLMLGDALVYNLLTGRDNLTYSGRLYGVWNLKRRIEELADFFEIGNWMDRYVSDYSLGMKAKLCFARALIHDPPILLLDEPTLGLDPHYALGMRNKIKALHKTIILTTHYMEEADFLSDHVGILHQGRLVAHGSSDMLKERLAHESDPTLTDVFIQMTGKK
jgi:ABC-2 type transport system ATP-binding protein